MVSGSNTETDIKEQGVSRRWCVVEFGYDDCTHHWTLLAVAAKQGE